MDDQSSSLGKSSFAALTDLAVCFMLSMLGRGFSESFTVFLLPISETFGGNRGLIISIYSLASLASALASPLVGRMFDRRESGSYDGRAPRLHQVALAAARWLRVEHCLSGRFFCCRAPTRTRTAMEANMHKNTTMSNRANRGVCSFAAIPLGPWGADSAAGSGRPMPVWPELPRWQG
jgi:hypothetical protein